VPLSKESEDDGSTGGGPRRKQKIVSFFFLICDDDVDRTRTVCVKDERGEWQRIHTRRETENGMKEIECVEWSSIAVPCRPRVFFNQEKKGARKKLECVGLGYNSCFI
jgi:hypothetical protein